MSRLISTSLFPSTLKHYRQALSRAHTLRLTTISYDKHHYSSSSSSSITSAVDNDKEHTVDGSTFNMEKSMNKIEQLYSDARDEIECAQDSKGTTYYHGDLTTAREAVNDVVQAYEHFIDSLPSDEMKTEVKQKVDMKMKELKMAMEALPSSSN